MSELLVCLGDERLVTLSGPGGTGKTRLAKKAARSLIEKFKHGVWFVDLTGVLRDAGVAGAVSRVLGILEEQQTASVGNHRPTTGLTQKPCWFSIIANRFWGGCAEFAQMVLSLAPETKILATSREPLHISGEYVRQVPPLTIDDGVALFQQRARQSGSENAGGSASSTSIRKIVERLDGVPLAIELAAARTSIMDADQILAGLDSRFDLLTGGMRDASVQHRSLRASVAWSYDLMNRGGTGAGPAALRIAGIYD